MEVMQELFEDGDALLSRRHGVSSLLFELWTKSSSGEGADVLLAPHYFDGTYARLEDYIVEGGELLLDMVSVFHQQPDEAPSSSHMRMHKCTVPVEAHDRLSYARFEAQYMARNQPVMVQGATKFWRANVEWTSGDKNAENAGGTEPAISLLKERYGASEVEVEAALATSAEVEESGYERPRSRIRFSDFSLSSGDYLKDWHFHALFPEDSAKLVPTPEFFCDDWLNDFAVRARNSSGSGRKGGGGEGDGGAVSDYRFVYLGKAGTKTHLHADVLGSFSWSSNVCGEKRWRFLSPELTYLIRDVFGRSIAPKLEVVGRTTTGQQFWQFPLLKLAAPWVVEVRQLPGDAIFVPSEWHHTVSNEVSSASPAPSSSSSCVLSVNQNWFNRHNLPLVYRRLRRTAVQRRRWGVSESEDEVAAAQQASKPPFDAEDFLRLLKFKVGILHRAEGSLMDLTTIYEIAEAISHDELAFDEKVRLGAAALLRCGALPLPRSS